jgi:translation initiation factor 2B subunit (eIF-2B alpha/beta/delta family)
MISQQLKKKINQIKSDNTSGSLELTRKCAEILKDLIDETSDSNPSNLIGLIKKTSREIINAKPMMASIINFVNNSIKEIDRIDDVDEIKKIFSKSYFDFKNKLVKSYKIISEFSTDLIKDNYTIIIHSNSSTILKTLVYADQTFNGLNVVCTESRPVKEGLKLARLLGEQGIKVKLIVDAAVSSFIKKSDLILIGADAVCYSGFINKIGTLGIAITSKQYNKPIYVVCGTDKFIPKKHEINIDIPENPKEIIENPPLNVTPYNYYFEITPLQYVSGFITDEGIFSPVKIKRYISNL